MYRRLEICRAYFLAMNTHIFPYKFFILFHLHFLSLGRIMKASSNTLKEHTWGKIICLFILPHFSMSLDRL